MRIEKPNLFPEDLAAWLKQADDQTIRAWLARRITKAMSEILPSHEGTTVSQKDVDALDERYFTLQEQGKKQESMAYFLKARLASAAMCMQLGDLESALYEFWHSQEEQNVASFIADIEKA